MPRRFSFLLKRYKYICLCLYFPKDSVWSANGLNEGCPQHGDKLLLSNSYKSYSKTHHAHVSARALTRLLKQFFQWTNFTYGITLKAFHNLSLSAESQSRSKCRHIKQKDQDPGFSRSLKHSITSKQISDALFASILAHAQLLTLQEDAVILVGHSPITVMVTWKQQRKWVATHNILNRLLHGCNQRIRKKTQHDSWKVWP